MLLFKIYSCIFNTPTLITKPLESLSYTIFLLLLLLSEDGVSWSVFACSSLYTPRPTLDLSEETHPSILQALDLNGVVYLANKDLHRVLSFVFTQFEEKRDFLLNFHF